MLGMCSTDEKSSEFYGAAKIFRIKYPWDLLLFTLPTFQSKFVT